MNTRSKSTLFLIEQLIVIAVFAICAAACISILASAYFTAEDSRDISSALLVAESGAEAFKATNGDLSSVARVLGGTVSTAAGTDTLTVYYDEHWQPHSGGDPIYKLLITSRNESPSPDSLRSGELTITKLTSEKDNIVTFPLITR